MEDENKDYQHNPDMLLDKKLENNHRILPYPYKELTIGENTCWVYDIPSEDMQSVIDEINPLQGVRKISVDDLYFDGLKNQTFLMKEAMIIRFDDTNYIVSPWFAECGSSFFWCVKWKPGMKGFSSPL